MIQKFSASLLATVAIIGAMLVLSQATAQACDMRYNACSQQNNDWQGNGWRNNDTIQMPVPYSNQFVRVPSYMWNFTWTRVTDEWGNYPRLDLRDRRGDNFPLGFIDCVQVSDPRFDYGSYDRGPFFVQGQFYGWGVYVR